MNEILKELIIKDWKGEKRNKEYQRQNKLIER